jgi:hypothetical protein
MTKIISLIGPEVPLALQSVLTSEKNNRCDPGAIRKADDFMENRKGHCL